MTTRTAETLAEKKCVACEGGVSKCSAEQVRGLLRTLADWQTTHEGQRIEKRRRMRNFQAAMDFLTEVGRLAESENHHPDLHLEGYRNARIEIWTHAVGGLTENDFILAAKIDRLC